MVVNNESKMTAFTGFRDKRMAFRFNMDIVTLTTYASTVQAELAKVFLESEGITCFVTDSTTNNLKIFGGLSSGVRLQVTAKDLDRARETLRRFEAQNPSEFDEEALMAAFERDAAERNDPRHDIEEEESPHALLATSTQEDFSNAAPGPDPTCANCGSWRLVRERNLGFWLTLLTVFLLGVPLLFIQPQLRCQKCGQQVAL